MALINFQCKKCEREFDCETGTIKFGEVLGFEKDIICLSCGKLNNKEIWLTELGQTQIGELYFQEEDTEKECISDLCDEAGTGFEVINEPNENVFYPLLFGIEESIYLYYKKDSSLDDSQIIISLKTLRDNILSEKADYNSLENAIIDKIRRILYLNAYSKRDVSLSLSKILNSVKLHRSMGGKRGYLNFICEFIDKSGKGYF